MLVFETTAPEIGTMFLVMPPMTTSLTLSSCFRKNFTIAGGLIGRRATALEVQQQRFEEARALYRAAVSSLPLSKEIWRSVLDSLRLFIGRARGPLISVQYVAFEQKHGDSASAERVISAAKEKGVDVDA